MTTVMAFLMWEECWKMMLICDNKWRLYTPQGTGTHWAYSYSISSLRFKYLDLIRITIKDPNEISQADITHMATFPTQIHWSGHNGNRSQPSLYMEVRWRGNSGGFKPDFPFLMASSMQQRPGESVGAIARAVKIDEQLLTTWRGPPQINPLEEAAPKVGINPGPRSRSPTPGRGTGDEWAAPIAGTHARFVGVKMTIAQDERIQGKLGWKAGRRDWDWAILVSKLTSLHWLTTNENISPAAWSSQCRRWGWYWYIDVLFCAFSAVEPDTLWY